jgi:hypothetical protein
MASMSTWSRKAPFRFGLAAFVTVLALALAVASIALARPDYFGGAPAVAPYTTTDGTGRALGYWGAYEKAVKPFAPYTEKYAGTDNISPHVPENLVVPFAPYTEKYAGTDNISPHVPENQIKKYAPYTELQPKPFWGQYLER